MYTQRDSRWSNIKLGYGEGTIGKYGCYLVSMVNGLDKFGWSFDPVGFNTLLKTKGMWTGEFRNYIDVVNLPDIMDDVFKSFKRIEPWDDMQKLNWYITRDYIILGKVDAKGIGGTGTHFVLISDVIGKNAIIHDPWTGENQKVSTRYGKYGNILGLRVFGINRYNTGEMELSLEDDISSEIEQTLGLKDHTWYDNHWTWEQFLLSVDMKWKESDLLNKDLEELRKEFDKLQKRHAEMASTLSERDKMITTLTNENNGLKNDLKTSKGVLAITRQVSAQQSTKLHEKIKELESQLKNEYTIKEAIMILINSLKRRR